METKPIFYPAMIVRYEAPRDWMLYLNALNATRAADHDLTPFLKFALKGVESQGRRLFGEIRLQVTKALFRNTMTDLFGRLKSPRKRA